MREEKIDIVYTWCDGSAPAFQRQRNELCQKLGMPVQSDDDQLDASKRYKQHDELLYSLRSVEKYAPWLTTMISFRKGYGLFSIQWR